MTESKICTCPSGDGSLVHPCPAHPAVEQADASSCQGTNCGTTTGDHSSECLAEAAAGQGWELKPGDLCGRDCPIHKILVKQAGGDERAEFERAFTVQEGVCFDARRGEYRSMNLRAIEVTDAQDLNLRLQGWQARAALAQTSPAQAEAERPEGPTEDELEAAGLGYPLHKEEAVKLWYSGFRSEVITVLEAWEAIGHDIGMNPDKGELLDSLRYMLEKCEAHDAALARVAELERGKVYVEARQCDECQHGGINDSATGVAACHECDWTGPEPEEDRCPGCQRENCMAAACPQCGARYVLVASEEIAAPVAQAQQLNDLDKQCRDDVARALGLRPNQERGFAWSYLLASIKSCVKASWDSAQAQHSVPEGLALIPARETEAMHDAVMALLYKGVARTDTQKLLDAYIAAAPGKEGNDD